MTSIAVRFQPDAIELLPRGDDPGALVGVFADSGPQGSRLGYSLLTFVSGVGYPDYAVFGDEVLVLGHKGVRAAGWLDHAWRLQPD